MKLSKKKSLLTFFIVTIVTINLVFSKLPSSDTPDYRNFYGIAWRGNPHENLAYARQMGYDYVYYQRGMEKDPLSKGLHFYVETPEYFIYDRAFDLNKAASFSPSQIQYYERNFALKNTTAPFPANLATGWFLTPHSFTPLLDFQQQRVIDFAVDSILQFVKSIERRNPDFKFGGFGWDEPRPSGDFYEARKAASLKNWTGSDTGSRTQGMTHQFSSYTDGHMAFFKQIFSKTRKIYPNAHFFSEPYNIYDGWIAVIKNRSDAKEITPDILSQEGPGTQFVDDERIYASGLVKKENIYSTTPNVFGESGNRLIAAKAAINGAGFGWFGRFGGTGDMPNYLSIREVPPRLKLIRMLTTWENLNNVPLSMRLWDGSIYQSHTAFVSQNVIALTQPRTNKIFFVFLTKDGKIPIPSGKQVASIFKTDNLFIESGNGSMDFKIHKNTIEPRDTTALNNGYIMTLK